jgi:hypothetical protein
LKKEDGIKSDMSDVLKESMRELTNYANGDVSGVTVKTYVLSESPEKDILTHYKETVKEFNKKVITSKLDMFAVLTLLFLLMLYIHFIGVENINYALMSLVIYALGIYYTSWRDNSKYLNNLPFDFDVLNRKISIIDMVSLDIYTFYFSYILNLYLGFNLAYTLLILGALSLAIPPLNKKNRLNEDIFSNYKRIEMKLQVKSIADNNDSDIKSELGE